MKTFNTTTGLLAIDLSTVVAVKEKSSGTFSLALRNGKFRNGVQVQDFRELVREINDAKAAADTQARAAANRSISVTSTGMNGEATVGVGQSEIERITQRVLDRARI